MEDNIKKLFEVDSNKIPNSIPIFPFDCFKKQRP